MRLLFLIGILLFIPIGFAQLNDSTCCLELGLQSNCTKANNLEIFSCSSNIDNDTFVDFIDSCPTIFGNDCNGCPTPICNSCSEFLLDCPSVGPRLCINSQKSRECNSTFKCSSSIGDNGYGIGGQYDCKGFCDGEGSCDFSNYCFQSEICDPTLIKPKIFENFPTAFVGAQSTSLGHIVLGANASASDVIAGSEIAAGIQYQLKYLVKYTPDSQSNIDFFITSLLSPGFAIPSNEFTSFSQSSIFIGEPCTNPLFSIFFEFPQGNCSKFLFPNSSKAWITIRTDPTEQTRHVLVIGNNVSSTIAAARVLAQSYNYELKGFNAYINDYESNFSALSVTDCLNNPNINQPCDFCGDSICGASESCTSCQSDCGTCPIASAPSSSSGGGGGGGGGSSFISTPVNKTANISIVKINLTQNSTSQLINSTISNTTFSTKETNISADSKPIIENISKNDSSSNAITGLSVSNLKSESMFEFPIIPIAAISLLAVFLAIFLLLKKPRNKRKRKN